MACVEIKVQVVLQFEVCRGRSEVLLSGYGRVYLSEIVSGFGPKTWPRCQDRETRIILHTARRRRREDVVVLVHEGGVGQALFQVFQRPLQTVDLGATLLEALLLCL